MKSFTVAVAAFAALAAANPLERRGCIADNCLRALTVTDSLLKTSRPVLAKADCSSFMHATQVDTVTVPTSTAYETLTTVISQTVTTFTTGTSTLTVTVPTTIVHSQIAKRDLGSIPAYASPCNSGINGGAVRFSSACSCIGVFGTIVTSTTTLAPISTTITSHETTTFSADATSTIVEAASTTIYEPVETQVVNSPFNLVVAGSPLSSGPRAAPYSYINIPFFTPEGPSFVCTHDPLVGELICNGVKAVIATEGFFTTSTLAASGTLFSIDPDTKEVTPTGSESTWYGCAYDGGLQFLVLGAQPADAECGPTTVIAVAAEV